MLDYKELPVDGIRFEQLVREILVRQEFDVNWTGVGLDGGRNLVIEERASGPLAPFERKWLVSCKHRAHGAGSVGVNDLDKSVVDSCRGIGATGFLLACSTQPSSGLITRFTEIENTSDIICRCWDGVEIEKRLMQPRTFGLIHVFFPKMARTIPWQVYNAGAPTFWCGSHRGHFFYMASRIASGVPRLNDVEEILKKLEAVPLAAAQKFGGQERLRLRAIYYDNKHENYLIFLDYLVPSNNGKVEVQSLKARQLLDLLADGNGLYSDEVSSWYSTHWDILLIKTNQYSDRFDQDARGFYEAFLTNFETGSPRDGAVSAFNHSYGSWEEPLAIE
jgi:Restriction endonuclease